MARIHSEGGAPNEATSGALPKSPVEARPGVGPRTACLQIALERSAGLSLFHGSGLDCLSDPTSLFHRNPDRDSG